MCASSDKAGDIRRAAFVFSGVNLPKVRLPPAMWKHRSRTLETGIFGAFQLLFRTEDLGYCNRASRD